MKRVISDHFNKKNSSLFFHQVLRINHAIPVTVVLFILVAFLLAIPLRAAQRVALSDTELADVTGQAGINIYKSVATRYTASVMKVSDTDSATPQWLEFRNVTVDDGSGGYFLIQTPMDDTITLDVGTNEEGRTLVSYRDTSRLSPRWYTVGDMVFCNQSLGSLNVDALSMGPSVYRLGAHADGTGGGYDFDYTTSAYAQAFRYTYNTVPETLTLSGIHLVNSATGAADNPADPTTWSFTGAGNFFRIGNIDSSDPAKVDVVSDSTTGVTSLVLSLPIEGSLRVENVVFGGNSFGPVAIDGIKAHRLTIQIR